MVNLMNENKTNCRSTRLQLKNELTLEKSLLYNNADEKSPKNTDSQIHSSRRTPKSVTIKIYFNV